MKSRIIPLFDKITTVRKQEKRVSTPGDDSSVNPRPPIVSMRPRTQDYPIVSTSARSSTLLRSQLTIQPSLGLRSLLDTPQTTDRILTAATPLRIRQMLNEPLGISDTLSVLPPAGTQDPGLGIAVNLGEGSSSGSQFGISDTLTVLPAARTQDPGLGIAEGDWSSGISPNSREPVGLGIGLPPFPKKVDFVSSFIPVFIVSFAYFSSYSVSELLLLLEHIGMDSMWVKEMLGMSESFSSLVHADQETGQSVGSDLQQVISNQQDAQYLRLLGIVAGSVAVGAIVLWVASYGYKI